MPGRVLKRRVTTATAGTTGRSTLPVQDLAGSSPDWLREKVFNALKSLPPDELGLVCERILSELRKAGVNIASGLLKLGIPAQTPDELSPGDVAKLVRYVRLNKPEAMKLAGVSLSALIAAGEDAAEGAKPVKKAA